MLEACPMTEAIEIPDATARPDVPAIDLVA
jgi:hypothetical protein